MVNERTKSTVTRGALLSGALAASASAAAALSAGKAKAGLPDGEGGKLGEVASIDADSDFVNVSLDSEQRTLRARALGGPRGFRAGDRVVVAPGSDSAPFDAAPLYLSVEGVIERSSGRGLRVAGIDCHTDTHSVVRAGERPTLPISAARASLRPGLHVGLLCFENRIDQTRIVDTVYVL